MARVRPVLLLLAAVAAAIALVPPVATEARRYEFVEAIQFALIALAVPALVVLGAPWARPGPSGAFDRWAAGRRRHPEVLRALGFLAAFLLVTVAWRTPAAVDGVATYSWLLAVELVSLSVTGIGLWLELVPSPPLTPRLHRPWRAVLAALAMWILWILAYLPGLSHVAWYHAVHHVGGGLSLAADQELATGVLWFAAACAFVPVVFWDTMQWLKAGDDPDVEMRRLVRAERRVAVRPARRRRGGAGAAG